jgi:uncharacterized protein (DUF58 family)
MNRPPPLPRFVSTKPKQPALLDLEELSRFENLLVFAKATVEGYFAGRHKSPFRGSSVEFADYKEYVAGDDIAHMDWRVYGRTRRLFIRQFEEETDMTVYLLVDGSASMRYAGENRPTKYFLAAKIAAALAYLMLNQGDKAALAIFNERLAQFIPPGGTRRHLHRIVSELERIHPSRGTGIARAVGECVTLFKKRGRLVIISDFLDDLDQLFDSLAQFLHRRFEVLLLQVVDPDEINLPSVNAARFHDLETGETVQVDPDEIRAAYRENMTRAIEGLAREADQRQIQHRLVDTHHPYLDAIEAYLGFRGRTESSSRRG